ncbi:betaine aldehyde dehydrogenase 2 [Stemphylium lycopersici]|uniref:aldehyde dehydrogenase (NAD(+)) n=1 Tax=Stemphylium lycopersici TaxID=183478 RepID=A0A364N063_STELY|nr:betaine aldehyde dehydrogenase 2 [Stemphylium lycopersici]RAR08281.1 betaine aldehyde dehydrogenase 2 [Stemphylium lycopersici]
MSLEKITTISPITNKPVLTRNGLSDADLRSLPETASTAFESYRRTSLAERKEIVKKAMKLLNDRQDVLGKEITEQMGRPIAYTAKEVTTAVMRGEYLLKISDDTLKDTDGEPEKGFKRYIKKVPLGPVLILFPWNYPYLTLINSLVPALLAGNSVILKPSPQTPTSAEQIQQIFKEAGLPDGVLQIFHSGSIAQIGAIAQSPKIQLVCFTGSVANGLAVQQAANDRVPLRVGLELGGKDPAYVRSDVDVKWAAEELVDGAVFNSGQSCCSVERVYVDEKIHDEFVSALQEVLSGYKLGDPFDKSTHVGPVVSKRSAETIQAHIKDALEKGAKDATPENATFKSPPPDGNYVAPTLLTDVTHEMTVMTEETFGPVIPVMKVKDDAEAIKLMNDSQFGLTASIWTKDVSKGHELADDIEAGTVFVNRCDYPAPDLAWVGWKDSGRGQTLSRFGFDQFVKLKSYHGGPTDVRRVDISESLPGLTDVQRKQIRKKASSDAACLKSLRSHPPIIAISPVVPNTPTPAPTTSPNPHRVGSQPINTFSEQLSSVICFYEPTISTSLSNAASKDEPSNLPTPPRLLHKEDDLPAMRMKSMWKSDKRYNSDSGGHDDILYETLPGVKEVKERGSDELKALNFEFDLESKESGSDASRKLGSIRASEMQDTAEYEQGLNDTTPKQHT